MGSTHYIQVDNKYSFARRRIDIYTYVCFPCRNHGSHVICQFCNNDMIRLGTKAKIPKKRDAQGWKKLEECYARTIACHKKDDAYFLDITLKTKATTSLMYGDYRRIEKVKGQSNRSKRDKNKWITCTRKTCHYSEQRFRTFSKYRNSYFVYTLESKKPLCKWCYSKIYKIDNYST